MTAPKVALLGMILESNRYAPPAERTDFTSLTWLEGEPLLAEARAETPSLAAEFAAFVRAMDATGDWTPVPCILAASHPAGPVRQAVFEEVAERAEAALRAAGPIDAVYVCNHGAMVAEDDHDPDGTLIMRVREVVGARPLIVTTLDLHANVSNAMAHTSDILIGYRTNPHVDMIERGEEAAFSLRRVLASGKRPRTAHVKLPLVPASVTLLTAEAPYGALIDLGQRRQAEERGQILNVSIFGNFLFSDVPENGVSVVVTARSDVGAARALAAEIASEAWSCRAEFIRHLTPVGEAVAMATDPNRKHPVIFSDAGDNPGGGGSGRTTELLAAFHQASATGVLYGSFCDSDLAAEAHRAGVGAMITARFNRCRDPDRPGAQWDAPFEAQARVIALHDGHVVGERGMTAGRRMSLGLSAALELDDMTVVVISDRTQTSDPVFFHMLGLDPGKARTVVVKSRGHFRAGFRRWFPPERVFEVDTAGLTSPVHDRWPLQHLTRPTFPIDPETQWSPPPFSGDA